MPELFGNSDIDIRQLVVEQPASEVEATGIRKIFTREDFEKIAQELEANLELATPREYMTDLAATLQLYRPNEPKLVNLLELAKRRVVNWVEEMHYEMLERPREVHEVGLDRYLELSAKLLLIEPGCITVDQEELFERSRNRVRSSRLHEAWSCWRTAIALAIVFPHRISELRSEEFIHPTFVNEEFLAHVMRNDLYIGRAGGEAGLVDRVAARLYFPELYEELRLIENDPDFIKNFENRYFTVEHTSTMALYAYLAAADFEIRPDGIIFTLPEDKKLVTAKPDNLPEQRNY